MPRTARQKSKTGIYHVMLKGIDGRNIFLGEGDRKKFVNHLRQVRERGSFAVLAYCLMDNHVHLLLEEKGEELGNAMKRVTVGYVLWHNNKYNRSGHLFQNRYRSEVVENDSYLLTVTRYIHQNPVKAGKVKSAESYSWSSYFQYIDAYKKRDIIIDPTRIMHYFKNLKHFKEFMNVTNNDNCMDYHKNSKLTDEELAVIIGKKYHVNIGQKLKKEERSYILKKIYKKENVTIRQLARVLGVSKGVVETALKSKRTGETSPCPWRVNNWPDEEIMV